MINAAKYVNPRHDDYWMQVALFLQFQHQETLVSKWRSQYMDV